MPDVGKHPSKAGRRMHGTKLSKKDKKDSKQKPARPNKRPSRY